MKRQIFIIYIIILSFLSMSAYSQQCENKKICRTPETEHLLEALIDMPQRGFMFGHHDDPMYGIGWRGVIGRSDVKSVCGAYPGVISFDLGHIELGQVKNLDGVLFDSIRIEAVAQYLRGGMVSLSWHLNNPLTGKDAWDVSDTTVVASILPGGKIHEDFLKRLDIIAGFIKSIRTPDGTAVPILFRPWHENTGSWFWWGEKCCTVQQYKNLWKMTYNRLKKNNVRNVLFAYSPGSEPNDSTEYLVRYPGDDIVDLIGFDTYQFDHQKYVDVMNKCLGILTEVGKAHHKAIAVTETGYVTIPDSTWWTKTLLPILIKYPICYVLVWRNANDRKDHFYAPYLGQVSANDFVKFYEDPHTLFVGDALNLY